MKTTDTENLAQLAFVALEEIATSSTNAMFREPEDMQPAALLELCGSITQKGVIQPILLRHAQPGHAAKYIIVAGERRFQASRMVAKAFPERTTIPAYIRDMTEAEALELQIIENLQREDINPIKEARGFFYLVKEKKLTTAAIAAKIGKSIDYVQERLRLTTLIPEAQELVRTGELPIKAGLKMARIPAEQQEDALEQTTDTIKLANKEKPKVVFKGLGALQDWMDQELWTDLGKADFDTEDPKLGPQGACSTCAHRAKNTGGLFDDITKEDKCLLASCYRTKQVNTYLARKAQLEAKYPGKTVAFRERNHSIDAKEFLKKELGGEIKSSGGGEEVTEKEMLKNKDAIVNVLVGIPTWHHSPSDKKTVMFTKPRELGSHGSTSKPKKHESPEAKAKRERKEADAEERKVYQEVTETTLTMQAILKQRSEVKQMHALRCAIAGWISKMYCDDQDIMVALKACGISWKQDRIGGGKAERIDAKTIDLTKHFNDPKWDHNLTYPDFETFLETATRRQLEDLALCLFYLAEHQDAVKYYGLNTKSIKAAATRTTDSWWKLEQARRKAATPAGKKGGPKK